MKRNLFILIIGLLLMPFTVLAADTITLTQADFDEAKNNPGVDTAKGINYYEDEIAGGAYIPYYRLSRNGNFILDGEINLDNGEGIIQLRDNNVTLNSNVTLTGGIKTESSTTNTLSGSGTVSGGFAQYGGTATINGSITFNNLVISSNANSTIINGGTFNKGLSGERNSTVTINGGTFKSGTSFCAAGGDGYTEYTINGGTFDGNYFGFCNEVGDTTIKAGTFTGGTAGAFIGSDNTKIFGGTFKSTGANYLYEDGEQGAIIIPDSITFDDILADGYQYSTSTESTADGQYDILLLNATEITVSKIPTDEPAETTTETNTEATTDKKAETKNPKTGDFIHIYVMMLIVSCIALSILRKRYN